MGFARICTKKELEKEAFNVSHGRVQTGLSQCPLLSTVLTVLTRFSVVIICSSVYVITDVLFFGNVIPFVNNLMSWMTQNTVLAVITCILLFAAATLIFVPHAILTFGTSWAFSNVLGFGLGLTIGLFVSFMGSALGAILSFLRSRYMMRDLVELFAERFPIVKAADRAIQRKGFKVCSM